MADYTYKDVIIDPEDPRVKIGKEYYFGNYPKALLCAISRGLISQKLTKINHDAIFCPFITEDDDNHIEDGSCIIRKKEPEKKYVPFDLTKEEDRIRLRGAWVRNKESERELAVTAIYLDERPPFVELNDYGFTAEELFEDFEFLDGTPCGKLEVEE